MQAALKPEVFRQLYRDFAAQNPKWNEIPAASRATSITGTPAAPTSRSRPSSTSFGLQPGAIAEIKGARALGIFGDTVTTDHISPAGSIKKTSPAGKYLMRARRGARGFQQLRLAPRQRPGDDARHLCQCAHQEPDGRPARRAG